MKNTSIDVKKKRSFFSRDIDILNGPVVSSSIAYAIPLFLASILAALYNAADIAVVGNLADNAAVASVGATATIIGLLVGLFQAVASGYGVILARAIGENDSVRIGRVIRTGYTFSMILGVLVAITGSVFAVPMLHITNCPDGVIDGAALYMRIYMLSVPGSMFYTFNSGILRIKGDTVRPFIYGAISGGANIALNFALVLLTGEAVASVAIATVVATYISAVLLLIKLMRMDGAYRLNPIKFEINWDVLRKIIKYGFPSMISSGCFSFTNIQVQSAINSFGHIGISGNTASVTLETFGFAVTNNIAVIPATFIGQSLGANRRERIYEVTKWSYVIWSLSGVLLSVVFMIFGESLVGIIIPGDAEAIAFGTLRLKYIGFCLSIHALVNVSMGIIVGYGRTLYQMIVNIIGVCGFRLFWMLVIYPKDPTPTTLYSCYPISFTIVLIVATVIVFILTRKCKKGYEFLI